MFQPNFVTFTSLESFSTHSLGGQFKGNQNDGFNFVLFADGSGGITKQMKDWHGNKTGRLYPAQLLATQEYLSAVVGGAINAPIRDCHFVDTDAHTVVMPFIEGKTGEELGTEDYYPNNHQGENLRLFDYLVANADRRPKNLIYTDDGRIVGIDHALCNFRPREPKPEMIAQLWNNGLTLEALLIIRPKLVKLWADFAELEFTTQHQNMINNLDKLIKAFQILSQYAVITKGDTDGHEFHGNQYTGGRGGTATLERPSDKFSFKQKQRILSQWSSTYRHRDFSEFLDRNKPYWHNEHDLWSVELFARNTGGHVTPANFLLSSRSMLDPKAEPLQEQCDRAIANADEFMGLVSDIAKPYHDDMVRGINDPDHTIASKFAEGSTVDLPLSSWTNIYNEQMSLNYAENAWNNDDPRNPQSALILHAPEGTVGADLAGFTSSPQILTGGRFSVDKVEIRDNGSTHVYLTQQQFYTKSKDWKKTNPNYLPNWFPQNFKPNLFVAKALQQSPETIQKGDVKGHLFHGNQYVGGIGGSEVPKVLYHGSPADPTKLTSLGIKGSKSRMGGYKGSGIKYVSMTDNPFLARLFGKNVMTIDTTGMKFLDLKNAFTISQDEPTWAGELQALKNLDLPDYAYRAIVQAKMNGGEIAFGDKDLRSALKADGYNGVVFDSGDARGTTHAQGAREYRIFSDVKPEQITGTQEVSWGVKKGDVKGHPFHGNQHTGGLGGGEHQDTESLLNEAIDRTIASLPTVNPKDNDWTVGQLAAPNSGKLKAYVSKNIAEKLGDKFDPLGNGWSIDEPIINIYGTPTKPIAQCFTRDDLWSVGNYNDINGEPQALWTYVGNATDPQIQEYLAGANSDYADEHFTRGDTQGFAEARIGEKEANDQALRESKVSELVGQWAQTSNNDSYKSLAIQQVVGEAFGLKEAVGWTISPSTQEDINHYRENNDEFLQAFVQAQYDATQQFLKDNNITSVQVYRGFSFLPESEQATAYTRVKAPDWAKGVVGNPNAEGTSVTVPLRPISAFASNYAEARNFAGNPGLIIQGTIPASQVFSLPTTGFGCLGEKEVVVLGNATDWKVGWASPPTKVVTKGDVSGHEFHGNQYTSGIGGSTENEHGYSPAKLTR